MWIKETKNRGRFPKIKPSGSHSEGYSDGEKARRCDSGAHPARDGARPPGSLHAAPGRSRSLALAPRRAWPAV